MWPICTGATVTCLCRAEGGCDQEYSQRDLEHVRCLSCGRLGHLSCKPATAPAPKMHCYNCGRPGHLGFQVGRPANLRWSLFDDLSDNCVPQEDGEGLGAAEYPALLSSQQ